MRGENCRREARMQRLAVRPELALEQRRADQASASLDADRVDGMDIGIAATERDDAMGPAARGLHQSVAERRVVGDDRESLGLEPFEYLGLGSGNRLFGTEILD